MNEISILMSKLIRVKDVEPATRQNFRLKTGAHSAIVAIVKPIKGPQGRQRERERES